jgi:hypothetical protein
MAEHSQACFDIRTQRCVCPIENPPSRMMTEAQVRELRQGLADNLSGWTEPDGRLVPTEPDPDLRDQVRGRLRAAIYTCDRILGEPPAPRPTASFPVGLGD